MTTDIYGTVVYIYGPWSIVKQNILYSRADSIAIVHKFIKHEIPHTSAICLPASIQMWNHPKSVLGGPW